MSAKTAMRHRADGVDISADMLAGAGDKRAYRTLRQIEPGQNPIAKPGDYSAIAAIGVIGAGAAPISAFDMLMNGLAAGGRLVLSFNDHALEDPVHEGRISEWTDCGQGPRTNALRTHALARSVGRAPGS